MKEQINGNDNCNMDSLGFGFNVGIEPDKVKDVELIQDFERIQKDTTDFCNIQVCYTFISNSEDCLNFIDSFINKEIKDVCF